MKVALCLVLAATLHAQTCSREALQTAADAYFDAIAKRDPRLLATAPEARTTENGREVAYGEGFFRTGGKLLASRRLIDTARCAVLTWGVIDETIDGATAPIMLAVRLAIVGGMVARIETILHRKDERYFNPQAMLATLSPSPDAAAPQCWEGGVRTRCPEAGDLEPALTDTETGTAAAFDGSTVHIFLLRNSRIEWAQTLKSALQ